MSFDVFLVHFQNGQLGEADRERVLDVLHRSRHTGPDKFGFYVVHLADGEDIELCASELEGSGSFTGCTFFLHGMTEAVTNFVFEVARTGDMTMMVTMPNAVPILTAEYQRGHLPRDLLDAFPEPALCETGPDLFVLLSQGFTGWKGYRDFVIAEPAE